MSDKIGVKLNVSDVANRTATPVMDDVRILDERASKEILARAGVPVPDSFVCRFDDERTVIKEQLGRLTPPYVVKVLSDEIVHKARVGGVVVGVRTHDEVSAAIAQMRERLAGAGLIGDAFLVESMVPGKAELIVGGVRDPLFGPCVAVGLGGALAEALGQVRFGLAPLTPAAARALIADVDALARLRTAGVIDIDAVAALAEILMAIGGPEGILITRPDVQELDVNPVIVSAGGAVAADAAVLVGESGRSTTARNDDQVPAPADLTRLFAPNAVAVIGASSSGSGPGNTFLLNLESQRYSGRVYVVHRTAAQIQGYDCVPTLEDLPEFIDYCFVSVGATAVPPLVRAARGRVAFMQVMSSGFGEAADGREVNDELLAAVRESGVRVIGPNCLGTYSPRGGLTFVRSAPHEPGTVGILSQSGGLAADAINLGAQYGMRFSSVVSLGNCADLGPVDLMRHYLADPDTSVIGMYLEDAHQARGLFEVLRTSRGRKPIVMLRGGTTPAGQASAASHTGALSGEGESWRGWARQSGVLLVTTLKEFVQTLRLAELSAARGMSQISDHVLLVGNGGGCSVLAADSVSRAGLTLHGWSSEARDRLDALPIPPGMSVENPVDVPATALVQEDGVVRDVFDILGAEAARPWVIAHLNLPVVRDNMLDPDGRVVAFAQKVVGLLDGSRHEGRIVLVLRGDGSADCARLDRLAREAVGDRGLPVFTEIDDAVVAIRNVAEVERLLRAV